MVPAQSARHASRKQVCIASGRQKLSIIGPATPGAKGEHRARSGATWRSTRWSRRSGAVGCLHGRPDPPQRPRGAVSGEPGAIHSSHGPEMELRMADQDKGKPNRHFPAEGNMAQHQVAGQGWFWAGVNGSASEESYAIEGRTLERISTG